MHRELSVLIALTLTLGAGCSRSGGGRSQSAATSAPTTSGTSGATTSATSGATSTKATTTTTAPTATTATTATTAATRPAPSRFLYSGNSGDASITELRIDAATGAPAAFGTVATGDAPLALVVDPTGRFLYSIERSEVTPFTVGAAGHLTPIGARPVTITGDYPMAGCVTPDGAFLLVTYYGGGPGGSVRAFAIGAAGGLTQVSRYALGAMANAVDVTVDATSRFAYVADEIGQTVTTLAIVPGAGTLVPVGAPLAVPDVRALALDAAGRFLVVMTSASPGSIQALAIGATGAVSTRGAPLGMGPHSPMGITRGPDGRFHVVTANSSLIVAALDAQGTLTEQGVTPVPAFGFPCALAVDASGLFVYTANFAGDDLSVLKVGPTGALTAGANVAIASRTAGVASQPSSLATVR